MESAVKDYLSRVVTADDEDHAACVEFAMPAYDRMPLHAVRQAFPAYVALTRHGRPAAVCGFRGGEGGLFLEQFMQEPLLAYVKAHASTPVTRRAIVELGALRMKSAALAPLFARHIESTLAARGFGHALALAPAPASSVDQWVKARAALAGESEAADARKPTAGTLTVSVLPLPTRG